MNCDEFLSDPARFLRRVQAESGRIAVYEAVEACAQALSEGLSERQRVLFVPKKTDMFIPIMKALLWDGFPVRKAVTRKDWLYLEEKIVNILNTISWMGMLYTGNFGSSIGQWEDCLYKLCAEMEFDFNIARVVVPDSDDALADHILVLLLQILDWLQSVSDAYEEDWKEGEARRTLKHKKPNDPLPIEDNWAILRALETGLADAPGHIGTLVTGSFAVESQRDEYSDLDVFAIFDPVPDSKMRDDLRDRLQVSNPPGSRTGGFEYLKIGAGDIHCMVFDRHHIDRMLAQFEKDGSQNYTIDLRSDETAWQYSPPAHRWVTGMILSDTDDILASFRQRAQYYPPQLRDYNVSQWTSVWTRYASLFEDAYQQRDYLTSLTALHNCIEAALRMLLTNAEIHAEAVDTKWLCKEVEHLSSEQLPNISQVLAVLPSDLLESLDERFEKTRALWEIACRC